VAFTFDNPYNSKIIGLKMYSMISMMVVTIMVKAMIIPSNSLLDLFSKYWKVCDPAAITAVGPRGPRLEGIFHPDT
jgi:hypothetical protein